MNQPLTTQAPSVAQPFREEAADGFSLGGFTWRHGAADPTRAVVIINAATSVRCRFYSRFADYLFAHGADVITYDYRGIGESRPAALRGFQASWSDWGRLDFEAMLQRARREFLGSHRCGRAQFRRLRAGPGGVGGEHPAGGHGGRAVRLLA